MELRERVAETVVAIVAALLLVGLLNATQFTVDAFQLEAKLVWSDRGVTEFLIPPLGSVSAATHQTPVRIQITLESINLEQLSSMLENVNEQQELLNLFQTKGTELLKAFVVKLLLLACLGGTAGALLLRRTGLKAYLKAGAVGVSTMVLVLAGTYSTFQVDAFNSPQFNGALQSAPWVISFAEQAVDKLQDLGQQIQVISGNYSYMFEQLEALEPLGSVSGEVKILHVSDIHNNPVALELVSRMVENYDVDFVIDTGDLSDYGTALEGVLTGGLAELAVPYIFVPGNHDSPATVEALEEYPNVTVLDEESVEVEGIRIFGLADPASAGNLLMTVADEKYDGHMEEMQKVLQELQPDLVAVHRPSQAQALAGLAPLILHGHDHSSKIKKENGSILIDAGTTGAAGIRGLQLLHEIPNTMVLLHMERQEDRWVLVATDTVSFYARTGKLSLERLFFAD